MEAAYSPARRLAAWGVHFYTALGLPLAYLCLQALANGHASRFFLFAAIACLVDATDGFLARKVKVKEVVPQFDGRKLDDIVDYIHFVALPMVALPALGMLPERLAPVVLLPVMASAYGFCQDRAKTDDAFVGFPSYWNIIVLYFYVMGASPPTIVGTLAALSLLVFVPIHYVYPSRTAMMQRTTLGLGIVWTAMIFAVSLRPEAPWAWRVALISLYYPLYYTLISAVHHRRVMARAAA
jgi:phosphatidylcholine synthase